MITLSKLKLSAFKFVLIKTTKPEYTFKFAASKSRKSKANDNIDSKKMTKVSKSTVKDISTPAINDITPETTGYNVEDKNKFSVIADDSMEEAVL